MKLFPWGKVAEYEVLQVSANEDLVRVSEGTLSAEQRLSVTTTHPHAVVLFRLRKPK
jgi:hypothetical protein